MIQSQQALTLNLIGAWDNQGGKLASGGSSTIRALDLLNTQGEIQALDSLDMLFTRALDNRNGNIISQRAQRLQAENIFNTQGWIGSLGTLTAISQGFNNQQGEIVSQQDADLTATHWNNPYGTLLNIDATNKRAEVQVKDNQGQLISLWVNYLALIPNADGSYAMTFYETRGWNQRTTIPTLYQNAFHWEHDWVQVMTWDPERHVDSGFGLASENAADQNAIGVSLSYGSQPSKSEQHANQTQSQDSTLTTGNNLNIHASESDINVQGSQLQAGKDITLNAARDVNLLSAENTQQLEGKNESKGGSVGVSIGAGQGGVGISVSASVNKGKGNETGNGLTHSETTLNAGNNLSITSGRDTTLTGAQVSGDKVTMDVGRNLTLTMLWSTGMRRMEVAGLDQHRVDASRKTVTIRQDKGKKNRVITIGERTLKWVLHYQHQVRPQLLVNSEATALFVALDGVAWLTPNGVIIVTKEYQALAIGAVVTCSAMQWQPKCWRTAQISAGYRLCWASPLKSIRR